jgi:hypothetical protein
MLGNLLSGATHSSIKSAAKSVSTNGMLGKRAIILVIFQYIYFKNNKIIIILLVKFVDNQFRMIGQWNNMKRFENYYSLC